MNKTTPNAAEYDPKKISLKWQAKWTDDKLYQTNLDTAKQPYYTLMMFPYPSAEGLHIGHIYTFSGADAFSRFKRMQGNDTFLPIGLDAFGIHSENYALKIGSHPVEQAKKAEENFYRQFRSTGNSFDWSRKLETNDPNYYKWTQWLFIQLFKNGLAERKKAKVNFCPSCKTVLADEQVIDGKCERCGSVVEKRDLEQWFFKITEYAERLLQNIPALDWAQKVKIAQHNWIGKKEGAKLKFQMANEHWQIEVFTTRPDTLYGATFLVVAPDSTHTQDIVASIKDAKLKAEVNKYIKDSLTTSEQDRIAESKEKTGVSTGLYATHPLTNKQLPIWIADYVLGSYGQGAIMAVPAHDQRDYDFAKKYNLEIKEVISPSDRSTLDLPYVGDGNLINSEKWNDLSYPQDLPKILKDLKTGRIGQSHATYHLRDWLISRQRYWGPPIPMIYCQKCDKEGKSWFTTSESEEFKIQNLKLSVGMPGWYPVSEAELPVLLPYIEDFKPLGTGRAPLANHPEFYETTCPGCGSPAKRETDVSDTFLDSSWYFLRYLATDWEDKPFPMKPDNSKRSQFLPVQIYIGGAEHSVLHLLYARFMTMFLHDQGYLSFEEPFTRFYAHGLIIKDGMKMSKSKGNVILPDPLIEKFGIDTVRLYLRFLGPFNQDGDFRDTGIEGMHKFVKRVWKLFSEMTNDTSEMTNERRKMLNHTIKMVTEEMEELRFNTAIAKLMTYYNFLSKQASMSQQEAKVFLQLLAPFAPHLTEELWERIGEQYSIHKTQWPTYQEESLISDSVSLAVQVNGKLRGTLEIAKNATQNQVEEQARNNQRVQSYLENKKVVKLIYVAGKVINFVVH